MFAVALMIAIALIFCFLPIRLLDRPQNRLLLSELSLSSLQQRRLAGRASTTTRRRGGILAQSSHLATEVWQPSLALAPDHNGVSGNGGESSRAIEDDNMETDDDGRISPLFLETVRDLVRKDVNEVEASLENQVFGRSPEERLEPHATQPRIRYGAALVA